MRDVHKVNLIIGDKETIVEAATNSKGEIFDLRVNGVDMWIELKDREPEILKLISEK